MSSSLRASLNGIVRSDSLDVATKNVDTKYLDMIFNDEWIVDHLKQHASTFEAACTGT
jgi:hypothetical protein